MANLTKILRHHPWTSDRAVGIHRTASRTRAQQSSSLFHLIAAAHNLKASPWKREFEPQRHREHREDTKCKPQALTKEEFVWSCFMPNARSCFFDSPFF